MTSAASRPSSPLTVAYENVQTVGKNLQTKCLGPNFEVLDRIPSAPEPAHHEGLCTRLKELVGASTDSEKDAKGRKINALLAGVIFKRPASPAQPKTEEPKEKSDSKGVSASSNEEPVSDEYKDFDSIIEATKQATTKIRGFSPSDASFCNQEPAAQKQCTLSALLFVNEYASQFASGLRIELALFHFALKIAEIQTDLIKIDSEEMTFDLNPSTTEGMAFICRWAKLLKMNSTSFSINNAAKLPFHYYEELSTISSQANGEIKAFAKCLLAFMKFGLILKKYEQTSKNVRDALPLLSGFVRDPRMKMHLPEYAQWIPLIKIWADRFKMAKLERSELLQRMYDCFQLHQEQYELVYCKVYNEMQALQAKSKSKTAFDLKYCRRLIATCSGPASAKFPSPAEFKKLLNKETDYEKIIEKCLKENFDRPLSDLEDSKSQTSSDLAAKKTSQKKRKSPSSSPPKNSPSDSPIALSNSSSKSSFSLDESAEESDFEAVDSPKSLSVSAWNDGSSFSALDLSSPTSNSSTFSFSSPLSADNENSPGSAPSAKPALEPTPSLNSEPALERPSSAPSTGRNKTQPRRKTSDSSRHPPDKATLSQKPSAHSSHIQAKDPRVDSKQNKKSSAFVAQHPLGQRRPTTASKNNSPVSLSRTLAVSSSYHSVLGKPKDPLSDSKQNKPSHVWLAGPLASSTVSMRRDSSADSKDNSPSSLSRSPSSSSATTAASQPKSTAERVFEGSFDTIKLHERVVKQKAQGDWRHGFADFVDLFLGTKYCRSGTRFDDTTMELQPCYQIYAEVEVGNQKKHVIFEYTFNQDKQCYHRFAPDFEKRDFIRAIVRDIQHTTQNPTPSESLRVGSPPEEVVLTRNDQQYKFIVSQPYDIVSYTDAKGWKYKIFKMQ